MKTLLRNLLIALLVLAGIRLSAQNLVIASGAGYKKPVSALIDEFTAQTGTKVEAIYGNLQMVASQAEQSGEVVCIIGDKRFLGKLNKTVQFSGYTSLGKGLLVLAYRKGVEIGTIGDIMSSSVSSVFMPQEGKAIYGVAGKETLQSLGYYDAIGGKLTQVATVPQVVSYLLTGEADAGFINLTEALANKEKLGGYVIVDQKLYKPIEIVAGTVDGFGDKKETVAFLAYIGGEQSKMILTKYGL